MKHMKWGSDNRNYIFEKRYKITNSDDMFTLDQDIMSLTKKSARISVVVGTIFIQVHVYCRAKKSKVSKLCVDLGFTKF